MRIIQEMTSIPHLRKTAVSKQLVVKNEAFLVLGAELQNSSMSSAAFMKPIWPRLAKDKINTVLGAVTWEQIEPSEGKFDFGELDQCITDARSEGLHLVLLWFGSFKNGLSTYVPSWVKRDSRRFPRAKLRKAGGRPEISDILSIFASSEARDADARAFSTLMQHIRKTDEKHSTVVMVQVENEIGVLGDSRDRNASAERAYHSPVSAEFVETLVSDWNALHESLKSNLRALKSKRSPNSVPSWPELFGDSPKTDELFMAYHYALYTEHVAAAGKSAYPIPLYTNVWQNYGAEDRDTSVPIAAGGGDQPGVYPSGGGVIDVLDIWQLMAPSLDFIAPDIYLNDYVASCAKYRHRNQPLFIPEQRRDDYGAMRVWSAFASFQAIGTASFGIDTVEIEHGANPFRKHYELLSQMKHHVLSMQRRPGSGFGFFFDELPADCSAAGPCEAQVFQLGDWELKVERSFVFGKPSPGSGMIIHSEENDARFLLVGWGFQVTFRSLKPGKSFTGILSFEEKEVINASTGALRTIRRLNGDETRSGQCAIMPSHEPDYGGFPISITIPAGTGIAEIEVYALDDD